MRMLMKVSIPVEAVNKGVKQGIVPRTVQTFVEQLKPESCYFCVEGGKRIAFLFFDLTDQTMTPAAAVPFFANLNSSIEFSPAMTLADMREGIELALKYA